MAKDIGLRGKGIADMSHRLFRLPGHPGLVPARTVAEPLSTGGAPPPGNPLDQVLPPVLLDDPALTFTTRARARDETR